MCESKDPKWLGENFDMLKTLILLLGIACALPSFGAEPHVQNFIEHPDDSEKKIEFFWAKPSGDGPFPSVILVHGYQVYAHRQIETVYNRSEIATHIPFANGWLYKQTRKADRVEQPDN